MSAELLIAIGMIGHLALVAILKLPSWNGSMSSSSLFLFRVPSGKIQMEIPDLLVYCGQDRFESLFDVFPVKEETVEITHPCGKKRNFLHLFFGNVACTDRTAGVSKKYVEVASVVADIKYRCVLWHIFFSDHSNLCTGDLKDKSEYCLDDPKGADILLFRRKSADDPFDQQDGDGQDQVSDHNNTDEDKSYHSLIPFRALYNADAHI
mgnify:FL=1